MNEPPELCWGTFKQPTPPPEFSERPTGDSSSDVPSSCTHGPHIAGTGPRHPPLDTGLMLLKSVKKD